MKKIKLRLFCLLSLSLIFIGSLSAKKVSIEDAIKVANNWYHNVNQTIGSTMNVVAIDSVLVDQEAAIYKFTLSESQFIWVSADDRHTPVLAYNLTPSNTPADIPDAYLDFQSEYLKEITSSRQQNLKTAGQHPDWSNALKGSFKSMTLENEVLPMMEVTWGQGGGYRQFTPGGTPTGCVAVAMLQIMRHWEYPDKGQGLREYTHSIYGDFAVNFDTVDLVWNDMPLNEPNTRIARLMLYGGIALQMNYAPDGSGAQTEDILGVLKDNFFYNGTRIRYLGRTTYGLANWIKMLKNELINGRPVIVSGHGTGGHAFNFDGFKDDFFHVNWGWSGSQNGYFQVSSLSPGSSDFSEGQSCIAGIFPGNIMMVDRPFDLKLLAGESKVNLAWGGEPNGGFEYFKIYRDGELVGQTTEKFFVDETVNNDQSYFYSVSAFYEIDSTNYESNQTPSVFCPKPIGLTLPYEENFEDGHPGWDINSNAKGFNWGTAKGLNMGTDDQSHFIGINSGTAGNNKLVSDTLVSNQIDLSNANLVKLSFDYILRQWEDIDHLYIMYRNFDDFEWVTFKELETTKSYSNWTNYKCYLPAGALNERVQLAFYYTDNGKIGYGAGIDNIILETVSNPGQPEFAVSEEIACMGEELVFSDQSKGTTDSYYWDFGAGANPRYADSPGPHSIVYSSPGMKDITLVLNGLDSVVESECIEIYRPPKARFTKSINYKTVSFQNTSTDADAFIWDFGDGIKVTQKNPSHVYSLSGNYLVKLIALGFVCDNDTIENWVNINIVGKDDIETKPEINVYPNPSQGKVWIDIFSIEEGEIDFKLYSITGTLVHSDRIIHSGQDATIEKDLSDIPGGLYFIRITGGKYNLIQKVFIR